MPFDPVVDGVTKFSAADMNPRFQALWDLVDDLKNGVVALLSPAISSFVNALHNHEDAIGGGKLTLAAIDASGYADGEYTGKVVSGVLTLQAPSAAQGLPVGWIADWPMTLAKLEARTGGKWLGCDGKTIGNAASNATARANADCQTLFEDLWEIGNTYGTLTLQDSAGSPVSIGVNAAADWAAARRIPLPDERGRTHIGRDNQGGTSANRVTASNADNVLGNSGAETHSLTSGENGPHTHNLEYTGGPTDVSTTHNTAGSTGSSLALGGGTSFSRVRAASAGSGTAHNNMQPYLVIDRYIRYK